MRLRPAHLLLAGTVMLGPVAACGSSSNTSNTTTTSGSASGSSSTSAASSAGGSSTALTTYCNDVHTYATQLAAKLNAKDYAGAQALAQSAAQRFATEAQAIEAESVAQRQADLAALQTCQKDAADASAKLQAAAASAYGAH
jgi:hypothetical protein